MSEISKKMREYKQKLLKEERERLIATKIMDLLPPDGLSLRLINASGGVSGCKLVAMEFYSANDSSPLKLCVQKND